MKILNTVNVIEIPDTTTLGGISVYAFPDNDEGNKAAESLFKRLVNKNNYFDEDERPNADECLDDGYFEAGRYYVAIVHTVPENEPSALDRAILGDALAEKFATDPHDTMPDHGDEFDADQFRRGFGNSGKFTGNEIGGVDELDI